MHSSSGWAWKQTSVAIGPRTLSRSNRLRSGEDAHVRSCRWRRARHRRASPAWQLMFDSIRPQWAWILAGVVPRPRLDRAPGSSTHCSSAAPSTTASRPTTAPRWSAGRSPSPRSGHGAGGGHRAASLRRLPRRPAGRDRSARPDVRPPPAPPLRLPRPGPDRAADEPGEHRPQPGAGVHRHDPAHAVERRRRRSPSWSCWCSIDPLLTLLAVGTLPGGQRRRPAIRAAHAPRGARHPGRVGRAGLRRRGDRLGGPGRQGLRRRGRAAAGGSASRPTTSTTHRCGRRSVRSTVLAAPRAPAHPRPRRHPRLRRPRSCSTAS